jgi:hypothetical protein
VLKRRSAQNAVLLDVADKARREQVNRKVSTLLDEFVDAVERVDRTINHRG